VLWLTNFFSAHIIEIYFIYGLGFFILGMAVALESGQVSALPLARATPWLAAFGLTHAAAEWADMLIKIGETTTIRPASPAVEAVSVGLVLVSFLMLLQFGIELVDLQRPSGQRRVPVMAIVVTVYLAGLGLISLVVSPASILWIDIVDVWTSYAAGGPAFFMTVWGLVSESRALQSSGLPAVARELKAAAIAFCWYAIFDVLFSPHLPYFPASVINSSVFADVLGIPVQLFRAANALVIAFFIIRALRLFAAEDRRRLVQALETERVLQERSVRLNDELRSAAREMSALYDQLRQSDEVHTYLLKRVVRAQEEERRRVARDLHDGVGQTLGGLGAGLGALQARMERANSPDLPQVTNLQNYAAQSIDELHRVVTDLRPSLLDELGLVAALRWYARHYGETLPISVKVEVHGPTRRLPSETEIVLFRIAQEALTNVVRHARANTAVIRLTIEDNQSVLEIEDDGVGFEPEQAFGATGDHRPWGLLGMQERAALVGGSVEITSRAWQGTLVRAVIPLPADERN
jgi:signal transduction histidine kinase